ncbi:MAG: hypothetical protein WD850_01225 [Candidatus Spechtbacterales bacterium]
MKKAIIAYSFGLNYEDNPCNQRLARAVERIYREELAAGHEVRVCSQWEVAEGLKGRSPPSKVVERHRRAREYLDSEEVTAQCAEVLRWAGEVIPVANSFLHVILCRRILRKRGFPAAGSPWSLMWRIGWIGFHWGNAQWQVWSPFHMLLYFVLKALRWPDPSRTFFP